MKLVTSFLIFFSILFSGSLYIRNINSLSLRSNNLGKNQLSSILESKPLTNSPLTLDYLTKSTNSQNSSSNSTVLQSTNPSNNSKDKLNKWDNLSLQEFSSNPKVPIVMYHSIDTFESIPKHDRNPRMSRNLRIPPAILSKNLKTIKQKGYTTITLTDLQLFLEKKQKIPSKSIILTFDDGWADNWRAFELLKEEQMVASFGIVGNFVGQPNRLNADQIKTMSQEGMDIVSHSNNHYNLARMNNFELDKDLRVSKLLLEKITNKPVESLIYPAGAYNNNVINSAKKMGYKTGTTTLPYSPIKGQNLDQPFDLTRIRAECTFSSNLRSSECFNSGSDFFEKM